MTALARYWWVGLVGTVLGVASTSSYAYIDPGTGSMLTTAILGIFAAIGFTCRKYFYRLKRIFRRKDSSTDSDTL